MLFTKKLEQLMDVSPYDIKVIEDKVVTEPLRRFSHVQKDAIKKFLDTMLEANMIRHSTSPCNSSLVLVPKKDGTYRICIDLRRCNLNTHGNSYPVPYLFDTTSNLDGMTLFISMTHEGFQPSASDL